MNTRYQRWWRGAKLHFYFFLSCGNWKLLVKTTKKMTVRCRAGVVPTSLRGGLSRLCPPLSLPSSLLLPSILPASQAVGERSARKDEGATGHHQGSEKWKVQKNLESGKLKNLEKGNNLESEKLMTSGFIAVSWETASKGVGNEWGWWLKSKKKKIQFTIC